MQRNIAVKRSLIPAVVFCKYIYISKRCEEEDLYMHSKGPWEPDGLTISYKELGTVSIDEWIHVFLEDMQALKKDHNITTSKSPGSKCMPPTSMASRSRSADRRR
jgi:hypothetical protein